MHSLHSESQVSTHYQQCVKQPVLMYRKLLEQWALTAVLAPSSYKPLSVSSVLGGEMITFSSPYSSLSFGFVNLLIICFV